MKIYVRPRRSTRKTIRKRRRYSKRVRKTTKTLSTVRWSNRDNTNLCHFATTGNATGQVLPLTTTFNLSDVAGSGEFQSLFDNYMIPYILYRFVMRRDTVAGSTNANPRIVWVHDFNDQVAPATYAQLRQYANCREFNFSDAYPQTKWHRLNVASLPLTYINSVTSATGPKWRQWFDTAASTVPHYGLKWAADQLYTGQTILLEAKIVMAFKGIS